MLVTRSLSKSFGTSVAVDGLDLNLAPGELYGFLGPNGAGKTTTIRMLAGLLRPSSGSVEIDGRTWAEDPMGLKRDVGLVPDTPPLHDHLTGWQHVQLVGAMHRIPRKELRSRGAELLAALELDQAAGQLCKGYSHGMRKKVHLAAVLVTEPKVLLLDEPTSGLDPASARALRELLLSRTRAGVTILLSTHLLDTAELICDRIGILAKGQLQAEGTVAVLRAEHGGAPLEDVFLRHTTAAHGEPPHQASPQRTDRDPASPE